MIIKDIPSVLKNAVLATTFILNNSNTHCSPTKASRKQIGNKCNFVYPDVFVREYILNNIIKSNLIRGEHSPDLYYKLRYYLAINWLENNFITDNYINFLLNYSYYGEGLLGLKEASKTFLGKDLTKDEINPEEAALLVEKLFKNSYYVYHYTDIKDQISKVNINSILSTMVQLGYLDKEYKPAIHINDTIFENTNIYQIFNDKIFEQALPLTTTTNNIYIYTTIYQSLQEDLNNKLLEVAKDYNLENVAIFGVEKDNIVTGLNISIKNGIPFYNKDFPSIKIQNLLKPLLYTELFTNNISVPNALMNTNIQNIINIKKFDPDELVKIFPSFSPQNQLNIYYNKNGNDIDSLYNMISQLIFLENELFNKIDSNGIINLTKNFHLPEKSLIKEDKKITLTTTLDNIVKSFAILNQEGKYYIPTYVKKINNKAIDKQAEIINTNLNINSLNKAIPFIKEESYNNVKYKVIFDSNMALVYYNNYTIGIYISNPHSNVNKYYILKDLASYVVNFLIQNMKA